MKFERWQSTYTKPSSTVICARIPDLRKLLYAIWDARILRLAAFGVNIFCIKLSRFWDGAELYDVRWHFCQRRNDQPNISLRSVSAFSKLCYSQRINELFAFCRCVTEPSINKATARASFRVRSRLPRCAFQPFQVKIGLIRAFVLSLTHIFNPSEWNCIEASANVDVFRVQSKDTREDSLNFCSYFYLSVYVGNCSFRCKLNWSCYEKFHFYFLSIPQQFEISLLHFDCRYENMRNSFQICLLIIATKNGNVQEITSIFIELRFMEILKV